MAYSKRQVDRILNSSVNGQPLIPDGEHLTLAQRVCESYVRRRCWGIEDGAIVDLSKLYRQASKDVKALALDMAQRYGVAKLDLTDGQTVRWRRDLVPAVQKRLYQLNEQAARLTYRRAMAAYLFTYTGRAWMLDIMTGKAHIDLPDRMTMAGRVLSPRLTEAFDPADVYDTLYYILRDSLGKDWRETFDTETDAVVTAMRGSLNVSLAQGDSITDAILRLHNTIAIDPTAKNFSKLETIVRTYILGATNAASLDIYQRNKDLLSGVEWLAARDSRVCPMCQGLNGTQWKLDDPQRLTPPFDSHYNCRCTIIPVVIQDLNITPIGQPPDVTMEQWLADKANILGNIDEIVAALVSATVGT